MTRKHFIAAAEIVRNIRNGQWTEDAPTWASDGYAPPFEVSSASHGNVSFAYTRAVQTAEVFIVLFQSFNPRFDQARFLVACGLQKRP